MKLIYIDVNSKGFTVSCGGYIKQFSKRGYLAAWEFARELDGFASAVGIETRVTETREAKAAERKY